MGIDPALEDKMVIQERFWSKVNKTGGCWIWTGALNQKGYGRFAVGRKSMPAHKVAWELVNGAWPVGKIGRHVCDNPSCVNPNHIIPGTIAENAADAVRRGRTAKKTECKKGHSLSGDNVETNGPLRRCRQCRRDAEKARYWLKKKLVD